MTEPETARETQLVIVATEDNLLRAMLMDRVQRARAGLVCGDANSVDQAIHWIREDKPHAVITSAMFKGNPWGGGAKIVDAFIARNPLGKALIYTPYAEGSLEFKATRNLLGDLGHNPNITFITSIGDIAIDKVDAFIATL
jgi:hypothetical protein